KNHPLLMTLRRLRRSRSRFTSPLQRTANKVEKLWLAGIETIESFCVTPWQPGVQGLIEEPDVAAQHARHEGERDPYFFTDGSCRNGLVGLGVFALNRPLVQSTIGSAKRVNALFGKLAA